jgi:ATP-dependent DNA helicase RecG
MRPEILNPLFAEAEVLKGVGPQVAKLLKRLDLTRVVDVLYHLPTGSIERIKAPAASASLLGQNVILSHVYQARENRSGRGPCGSSHRCGRQHDQPRLFQQSGLGVAQPPQGRSASFRASWAYGDEWRSFTRKWLNWGRDLHRQYVNRFTRLPKASPIAGWAS